MSADIAAAVAAYKQCGSKAAAARLLGIPVNTLKDRLTASARPTLAAKGRKEIEVSDGVVLIGSDAHFWPGDASTAFRAFVLFCKKLKPTVVVMNGDVLDAAGISRHPPIGWNHQPTVKQELEVAQDRLHEIERAAGKAQKIWTLGNHDARFETRLAQVAPEFKDVHGISLQDHFPLWAGCWSLWINGDVVVKHRFKGGANAGHNNVMWSGKTMVTGHLHSLKVTPFSDYSPRPRWGIDSGTLADVYSPQFADYTEDNPRNWRSGFVVLTFRNGCLVWPEMVHVYSPNNVEFRGELITV